VRLTKEKEVTTEEVFTLGKAGGPLDQGEDPIVECQFLLNGQLNLRHSNPFLLKPLQNSFEEGIKQYKEQFQGPGLDYIESQIEACASKGFIQNSAMP